MRALFLLAALLLQGVIGPAFAAERVTLRLKWTHAFQFAGYYAAQELGYYREAGLEVEIREGKPGIDVVREVVSGQADYGVGTSGLLLARAAGQPVVALAVIFQHSPQILIAARRGAKPAIGDLAGKRIMLEPQSEELLALLRREGVALDRIQQVEHSFEPADLIAGKVDAMSAYLTSEPYHLAKTGFDYQVYAPRMAGIEFYGDNLFTAERELNQHPERAKAFVDASLRGWAYAMAHPDQIIDIIAKKYAPGASREFLLFEAAQSAALVHAPLIEVGYMSPVRWRHIAATYAELRMLPPNYPLDGFLYEPTRGVDPVRVYVSLAIVLGLAGAIGALALYLYRINRRLKHSLAEVKRVEGNLRVLELAIEHSPAAVVITGPDTVIQYVNPHFTANTGYTPEEVLGQTPKLLRSGMTEKATYEEMWRRLGKGEAWVGELMNRRRSGELYWEEAHIAPVKDAEGNTTHYVAVKLDISERKQALARLDYMAHHDALTGLPNRMLFYQQFTQGLALARRNTTRLALLSIDLDRFKPINDDHGHAAGDLVLQEAARRMSRCVRESDAVARIGGDEFAVLLNDVGSAEGAALVASKIRAALNRPFEVDGKILLISSSIGIALYPDHGADEKDLSHKADVALYAAKAGGRDKAEVYVEPMVSDNERS